MSDRGPGRPRETSHDELRDIALGLFLEQGYANVSLAQIARAAGISRTTLFAYFPAKRDLIWEDFDRRVADLDDIFRVAPPRRPLVDVIVDATLANSHYTVQEHAALARRMRIVEQDDGLRAVTALAAEGLADRLAEAAKLRAPDADPGLIDLVTRAVGGAASQCIRDWALSGPRVALHTHTAVRLRPIVDALRPLLP